MNTLPLVAVLTVAFAILPVVHADDHPAHKIGLTFGPSHYLHRAHTLYNQKERLGAARELAKAASMLDVVADFNKDRKPKEALQAAAVEMRKVAAEVKEGKVVPTLAIVELAMAKANAAMALHHFNASGVTIEDEEGREAHLAGHHLLAAAHYMEEAAKLSGTAPSKPAAAATKKVTDHATAVVTGSKPTGGKIDQIKQEFADHLRKLGQDIENRTAHNPSTE